MIWRVSEFLLGSKLRIGRETTVVTGPLTPDGKIDYAAALHERLSEGIRPEENAAILIDQAFGPGVLSPELRSQYFERIGTEVLPEQGNYALTQSQFMQMKRHEAGASPDVNEKITDEFGRVQNQPWTRADNPLAAEWLEANAKPLELIEQATRRSRYYSPLVTSTTLMEAESTVQNVREAIRLLAARAMFRLGADDVEGAWSDLLAGHRLAALVGQRPSIMISNLVAIALNSVAAQGDAALIAHGLSLELAQKCLEDFDRLPAFGSMADVVNQGDRFVALDSVFQTASQSYLDVNIMLRDTNKIYDDIVSAMKLVNVAERLEALDGIEQEMKSRVALAKQPLRQIASMVIHTRRTITHNVDAVLLGMLTQGFIQANSAQMRHQIRLDLVRVGFALAACHAEKGKYPQTLDELAPKYLSELPLDRYSERPLVYVPRENGFLIYSIGANGKDDGGRMRGPGKEDDIPFEIPPKIDD